MERWIADTEPLERFPIFTRGNADEGRSYGEVS